MLFRFELYGTFTRDIIRPEVEAVDFKDALECIREEYHFYNVNAVHEKIGDKWVNVTYRMLE